jgi:hypothetical protein
MNNIQLHMFQIWASGRTLISGTLMSRPAPDIPSCSALLSPTVTYTLSFTFLLFLTVDLPCRTSTSATLEARKAGEKKRANNGRLDSDVRFLP